MVTTRPSEISILKPLYALWGLGGIIGLPTLLFGIGFLVYKGHVSLLNLPSVLLDVKLDHLVFNGGTWVLWTLKVLLWHWSTALIVLLIIVAAWFWRRFELRRRRHYRPSTLLTLIGLVSLSGVVLIVEFNLLSHTSNAFVQTVGQNSATPGQEDVLQNLLEGQADGVEDIREMLYRVLSISGILVGSGLIWILTKPAAVTKGGMRTGAMALIALNALYLAAVVLCALVLLSWPLCYGRLMLSYDRPVVEVRLSQDNREIEVTGIVLNPNGERWVILSRMGDESQAPTSKYFNVEIKDLKSYKLLCYKNLFSYNAEPSALCQ